MGFQILPDAADLVAEILGPGLRFDLMEIQRRSVSVEEDDGFHAAIPRQTPEMNRVMKIGLVEMKITSSDAARFLPRTRHVSS